MELSESTFSVKTAELSDSTTDSQKSLRFEIILQSTFCRYVTFPELSDIVGDTRWVLIKTKYDRDYKILMFNDGGGFSLRDGWSLLAATENLEQGQTLMFQMESQHSFHMWINDPSRYTLPVGFSPERASYHDWPGSHVVYSERTEKRAAIVGAVHELWHASSIDSPIYACRLLRSASEGCCLIFNTKYSKLIPKSKSSVAMRFLGSKVIIPGSFKRYTDGSARISSNWNLYAQEHNLKFGDVLVCTILRGLRVWEFIGFVAGRDY